jgi:hypothetical protein
MIRATGAEEIALVAAAVRAVGSDRKIVNDMRKEIRKSVKPIRTAIRENAIETLPHRGGLGAEVARLRVTGVIKTSASSAGVTIRGSKKSKIGGDKSDLRRMDQGMIRHPSWGHSPWSAQKVAPGFFTDAVTQEGADQLEQAVITAAENAARRIVHG